ncbi:MAG TPA: hypothetical protein EYH45_01145 [Candidatus Caldiarchaeum subterraneum]|uniref:Glycosyl hydrolase n=1 Tax=Caldiarchaeum subterraneum TaxID=311458 RepID=A0A833EBE6_CALS0|nr:hypothetical protein [Aigarchaeota archaeon]HIQ29149.1 hypothetical protein [Candidatus Caldarchaeum subterraneum]
MAEREEALDLLCERVISIRRDVGNEWPYYADPETGRWVTTKDGDWCAGQWIEMLRIVGDRLGMEELIKEARDRTERIRWKIERDDMFRSMMFYYSAARLWESLRDVEMQRLALDVAYRERAMAIPCNGAMPIGRQVQVLSVEPEFAKEKGSWIVAVDNVFPNLLLDWWAYKQTGDKKFIDGARRHLDLTARDFIRPDNSTVEFIEYDSNTCSIVRRFTLLGYSDDSCWSRGQAWAIAGYLRAYEESRDLRYLDIAKKLFDFFWDNSGPDHIPPWDFLAPNREEGPVDTSAAAIVASALARIAVLKPVPEQAKPLVEKLNPLLDGLCKHLTPVTRGDKRPPGMLVDGCFNHPRRFADRHELIWGDFYLLEALYCLERGGLPC